MGRNHSYSYTQTQEAENEGSIRCHSRYSRRAILLVVLPECAQETVRPVTAGSADIGGSSPVQKARGRRVGVAETTDLPTRWRRSWLQMTKPLFDSRPAQGALQRLGARIRPRGFPKVQTEPGKMVDLKPVVAQMQLPPRNITRELLVFAPGNSEEGRFS